ncbi:MAG: Zn-ribbon domain-containing OB-fold protein [Burkholderiales bacterium]
MTSIAIESQRAVGAQGRYADALAQGRFELPRCAACGAVHFPPRVMCPHCAGTGFEWLVSRGRGVVHAATTVRRRPDAGGDLGVCLIDLDEGVRLMSRVEGLAPHEVRIGLRVVARPLLPGADALLVFAPDPEVQS